MRRLPNRQRLEHPHPVKRVLAIIAAVGMVLAALVVRGTFSADGEGGGGPDVPSDLTIACPPEVFDACQAAFGDRAVSQQAGTTLDQVEAGTVEVDAWLVSRPWAEVAQADVPTEIDSVTATGARSPIVIAIWKDRREALASDGCERPLGLGCLGDVAGTPFPDLGFPLAFEDVAVGYPSLTNMTGFDVVAAGASSYFARDDFASNDFDGAFQTWVRAFQGDVTGTASPFDSMLTIGPPKLTATVGLEADLRPVHERAARRDEVDLIATKSSAELVVVDFTGGPDASGVATDGDLLDALSVAGWRVPGRDAAPALPPTGDTVTITSEDGDGMAVKPGVLAALRSLAERER